MKPYILVQTRNGQYGVSISIASMDGPDPEVEKLIHDNTIGELFRNNTRLSGEITKDCYDILHTEYSDRLIK